MAGMPRWREIADDLLNRIEAGEFASEGGRARLPAEMELRNQYGGTSRNTVREALAWLIERGYLESERGKGTFVVFRPETLHVTLSKQEGTWPGSDAGAGGEEAETGEGESWVRDAVIEGRRPSVTSTKISVEEPSPDVARYLQIPVDSTVVARHQKIYVDERPWVLQTSFYPQDFTAKAPLLLSPKDIEKGTVAYLGETHGFVQGGYHDELTVRVPTSDETSFFGLSDRASVLLIETLRTAYDERTGKPFRVTVTIWPADRNRLHYNVGKVPRDVAERPSAEHKPGKRADLG